MKGLCCIKEKNFTEKIGLLKEIGENNQIEYLSELYELYLTPSDDKTVDVMVEHVIRDLLIKNEDETIKGILSTNLKIAKLAIQIAGRQNFQSAIPIFLDMSKTETNPDILCEVFVAMSKMKHPEFLKVFQENIQHSHDVIAAISQRTIDEYD